MLSKTFAYHIPSEEGLKAVNKIRIGFTMLENLLKELCPASRELAVYLTNLEQAGMWAIKSVTHNDSNSSPLTQTLPL